MDQKVKQIIDFRVPDLMEKSEIYQDRIITLKSLWKPKLNINFGVWWC
ncbi:unnamed protein product [Paramecium sonneborni]|uniref:Uncharacterized protein n=1 Tax=Paramecium sonneborni TaxID=65129 RepID=A0A8S1QL00_9CILI|nr:unnamed protein product [Paramecium sonneborni]